MNNEFRRRIKDVTRERGDVTGPPTWPSLNIMRSLIFWIAAVSLASNVFSVEPTPTKWTVDGVEREALVFLPSTSSKAKPPGVFAFPGHGGEKPFSPPAAGATDVLTHGAA